MEIRIVSSEFPDNISIVCINFSDRSKHCLLNSDMLVLLAMYPQVEVSIDCALLNSIIQLVLFILNFLIKVSSVFNEFFGRIIIVCIAFTYISTFPGNSRHNLYWIVCLSVCLSVWIVCFVFYIVFSNSWKNFFIEIPNRIWHYLCIEFF